MGGYALRQVILCLAVASCSALPRPPVRLAVPPNTADDPIIYVVDRGWHTDIGVPADEIQGDLATLKATFPGVRTMVFGFGERAWVLEGHRGPGDMLLALIPGAGLALLTALRTAPQEAFPGDHVLTLRVTPDGIRHLLAFIAGDLERDPSGGFRRVGDGPYAGSLYYASSATYAGYYTCNTWTADALASAGLPVDPNGVVLAGQLMSRARRAARLEANEP